MRKKIIAGNWKMNTTARDADTLVKGILGYLQKQALSESTIILCPPFTYLERAIQLTADTPIAIGAQNCSEYPSGAYTGEISTTMLKSLGVSHVIIGHSERRQYFGEQGTALADKVSAAVGADLTPIYCCGEPQTVREAGKEQDFVYAQLEESLFHLDETSAERLIIAYEPIWAIGTGRTATIQQIQEMHSAIKRYLSGKFRADVGETASVIYGGSVTDENAKEIFACPDVDGGLVGGASLRAEKFMNIVTSSR